MAKWVYYFTAGGAEGQGDDKATLGGKGASLAAMCNANLPVPPGFTISTACCKTYLESGGWPEGLEQQVRDNLARLEKETGRRFGDPAKPLLVSVRSGAAASMPGMMDTLLNCGLVPAMTQNTDPRSFWRVYAQFSLMFGKTVAGIPADDYHAIERQMKQGAPGHHEKHGKHADVDLSAEQLQELTARYQKLYTDRTGKAFPKDPWETLRQCIEAVFNSWNNDRAITYRREHDIRGLIGTAVNVQAMFPSEVSGIVFTTNPNDLGANEMVIEASFGLGEAVVSGDVHPDLFIVDRNTLAIKRSVAGHKSHVFAAMGDTAKHDADALSLNHDQLLELVKMSLNVEKFFGKPMDIEWGFAGGQLALLQSRAVRGLEIAEDVEIGRKEEIHRLEELASKKRRVWVKHNLAETLAAPTPLTWDIVKSFMSGSGGFGKLYRDLGYQPSKRVLEEGFLELICGRIYADPERAAELFWDGLPRVYDVADLAKNPRNIETAPTKLDPEKADGYFLRRLPKLILAMRRNSKTLKRIPATALKRFEKEVLPPYLEWIDDKKRQDLKPLSTASVMGELRDRIKYVLNEFGGESLLPGFLGGLAQASLQNRLCMLMGDKEGQALTMALTQGLPGDTTIEQNINLFRVARGQMTFENYIDRYGHRAVGEMELSRPRYREDSSYPRQLMGVFLDEKAPSPEKMHHDNVAKRQTAEKELPKALETWGGTSFREDIEIDLKNAQAMLPYRENGKHYLMMGYEAIRTAISELSRRWDLGRDVFYLQLDELDQYEENKAVLQDRIKQRKIRYQSARKLEVSDVIDSEELETLGLPKKYESANELPGEPIASGAATGQARIIFDPSQAADLCTDYILVCPSTDPSWTGLFVHARGLVVEQGGVLSHGAIVARDYGIPAVVCPDATKRIPDRSTIRIDGKSGTITILEQ